MHAYLIIGPDASLRKAYIENALSHDGVSQFDRIEVTGDPSIGIAEIRLLIKRLSLAPSGGKLIAGIIPDGDLLTPESQHALLKTLEEPPRSCSIYIGISHADALLPTIASRCQNVYVAARNGMSDTDTGDTARRIHALLNMTPGRVVKELSLIGKTKEDHQRFLTEAITAIRTDLVSADATRSDNQTRRLGRLLHKLLDAEKYQANNVSPLLLLEHAVFTA